MKLRKVFILINIVPLCACSENVLTKNVYAFDTMNTLNLYEGTNEDLEELEKIIVNYDKLCDNYHERDVKNVYTINNSHDDVVISEDLYKLLQLGDTLSADFDYFSIYCGGLTKLWKSALESLQIPDKSQIDEQLENIKNTRLLFKGNNTVQRVGNGEIDLGAITKGYVSCRCFDYLNSKSLKNYLLSFGDSSIVLGQDGPNGRDLFEVGINNTSYSLNLDNCFLSTSGIEHQSAVINGTTYSHIVNPITGGAVSLYETVIVVAPKGYLADVLSTVFMMSNLEAIKNLEKEYEAKAIVISGKKVVYSNPDFEIVVH